MEKTIKLDAVEFNGEPTDTQLANTLRRMEAFLGKAAGALLLSERYGCADPQMAALLNATVTLRAAGNAFEGGAGLQIARPQPQMVR